MPPPGDEFLFSCQGQHPLGKRWRIFSREKGNNLSDLALVEGVGKRKQYVDDMEVDEGVVSVGEKIQNYPFGITEVCLSDGD